MLKIYNTANRKIEKFKPQNETVKIYTCGPTVYGFQHIGNYASYIYWDLLIRTLKFDGYKVKRVLNFTDVGHLTSDADSGEDKLEKGAAREGKSVYEIAKYYGDDFMRNFKALNLTEPEVIAHATDYVKDDMKAVDKMTANGFTYETSDGIYFDTGKFNQYADFAKLDLKGLQAGARVDFSSEKHLPSDFAVWKFIKPDEKHAMRWDYLGKPGYPGWHLECSTIIEKELGSPIDIHTGGIDHIPVHHTNEIAQTYAMTGQELARYWLHCNFITIDGEKISKSLGNTYTLDDLVEHGFSPMDYKMWVLSGHYQGTRNFTFESLAGAKARRLAWRNRIAECYQTKNQQPAEGDTFEKILDAVNDNLNSPKAFALIDALKITLNDWQLIDKLFGLNLIKDSPNLNEQISGLITKRETARKEKDFILADQIRDTLASQGVTIKDTPNGPIWQYE
ncbi:cysteine--tRNA ligase [Candidatus Saccharibacteria bacterium]|nr:cysteine--tRNA ligase [Candidatus Saccharibacteria bacterium]